MRKFRSQSLQSRFSRQKKETEQVVRNRVEEQTARNKQAEAWGPALSVFAQNMGIPAHSSSVPVSAVGAAAAQQSLILPSVQHDSEAAVTEKRPAPDSAQEFRVLLLTCCHFT